MKKLCENGHLNIDGSSDRCALCNGNYIYETEEGSFVIAGEQAINVNGCEHSVVSIYVPDGIYDFKNFIVSDNMITCNFIDIFRFKYLNKLTISELPEEFFEFRKINKTLRIEFCSRDFWYAIRRLVLTIEKRLTVPESASDAIIMKEVCELLNDDWIG